MILALISYFVTLFFVVRIMENKHTKHKELPTLQMMKNGVFFHSKQRHRIQIENCKYEQVGNCVYVTKNGEIIQIKNVDNVIKKDEYLYFKALGNVEILCQNFNGIEYFYLHIMSAKFNINTLKQEALTELINNNFEINFCKNAKKYLIIVKNVLKITIFEKKLTIKQNKFKFPFQIQYSINGKNKIINLN